MNDAGDVNRYNYAFTRRHNLREPNIVNVHIKLSMNKIILYILDRLRHAPHLQCNTDRKFIVKSKY